MKKNIKYSILFAGTAALTFHILNRMEYSRAKGLRSNLDSPRPYYDWRFGKVAYTRQGSGSPLLLLHDLTPGSSSYEFHRIVGELAKKYQVYTLDYIGYGFSEKPDMTYTGYLYVQLVSDFIKNIIKRKTTLICSGHSCHIGILTCHNDQDLVQDIAAINPISLFELSSIPTKRSKLKKFLLDTPVLGTFLYNLKTSEKGFQNFFEDSFFRPDKVNPSYVKAYRKSAHMEDYHSKHSYSSFAAKYTNINIIHALKEIDHSMIIMGGGELEDMENRIDNYKYYNQAIESVLIPGTRSLPHLENPGRVLQQLKTLLL